MDRLGFVQADPIRRPARAEELILRQRVVDYRVGDLFDRYEGLGIEEDFLYAHGFMTSSIWRLLHPRRTGSLEGLDLAVFEYTRERGVVEAAVLAEAFGNQKTTNWWGGSSQATRMALERLHYQGYVKIVGRQGGSRVYGYFEPEVLEVTTEERLAELVVVTLGILGPVSMKTLNMALGRVRRWLGPLSGVVADLVKEGRLAEVEVDGLSYVGLAESLTAEVSPVEGVKFLAPFDPVVWDRQRFEHLWGWPYRFEAYVPAAKRVRGYYALPILWDEQMVGWVNVYKAGRELVFEDGYVNSRPKPRLYQQQFAAEVDRMRQFLRLD